MLTALITDDEPLARAHLRRLVEAQQVQVIGEAETASLGLQMTEALCPDLLFLDVQMPGLDGLQAASAILHLDRPPMVVFVTGYSEYAVTAFEHAALDYLVKPVSPERLAKTLTRARVRLANQMAAQAPKVATSVDAKDTAPLQRLPVREDYAVRLLRVEDIICAVAREKRVMVRTSNGEHRTYYTLTSLESLLPRERFLRIHDSCIVNVNMVEEVLYLGNHTYAVQLSDGSQLPISRTRYPEVQRRLGLDIDGSS